MSDAGGATADEALSRRQRGFLGFVERAGNLLPEPTMIFVYLIAVLMVLSALGDALDWSAALTFVGAEAPDGATLENGMITYSAASLFSAENVGRLLTEMPRTMAGFAPLGTILVILAIGILIELVLFGPLERRLLRSRGLAPGGAR